MITIQVKSGYNGNVYQLDTDDEEMAAKWLLQMAMKYGPEQGGIYSPMMINRCNKWDST